MSTPANCATHFYFRWISHFVNSWKHAATWITD